MNVVCIERLHFIVMDDVTAESGQSPSSPQTLWCCRRLIKEMEEKQKSEKAELERMQQEVESQRKESEQVQLRIRSQEESLHRRSQDIESRLRDLIAEKEKFQVSLVIKFYD